MILLHRQMRGTAYNINKYYASKDKRAADLYKRLISTFGTETNFNDLRIKLNNTYFNGSTEDGRLEIFIHKFVRLHRRLYPMGSVNRIIDDLIRAFPAGKRDSLIAADIKNIEKFTKFAKRLMVGYRFNKPSGHFHRTASGSVPSA